MKLMRVYKLILMRCVKLNEIMSVSMRRQGTVHANDLPSGCYKGVLFPRVGSQRQIVVQRDYGAMHSFANWDSLNWLDFTDVEEEKVMQVAPGRNVRVPLVDIRVDCEVVSGTIRCGYFRTMSPGVDLIIGNDVVTVEEPLDLEGSISTNVVGVVEGNEIDAVNVRNVVCSKVETKKRDECTNDVNEGDLFLMCDDLNENGRMISDDVSGDEIIQIQSRMNAEEKADSIDKQVLVQPDVCKDECTHVINDAGSCVDLSERQSEEQLHAYDDKCTNAVNAGDLYRMVIDLNDENELQEVVVVPNYVAVVSCENDLSAQLSVSEVCTGAESPVEIVHTGECVNVELEVSLCVVESLFENLKWMLLKNVGLEIFVRCFVNVMFEL